MKVYVDENDDDVYPDEIDMKGKLSIWFEESECELEHDIELHLLADHDKEVRKQVCDEIENMFKRLITIVDIKDLRTCTYDISGELVAHILDEVRGGDKE